MEKESIKEPQNKLQLYLLIGGITAIGTIVVIALISAGVIGGGFIIISFLALLALPLILLIKYIMDNIGSRSLSEPPMVNPRDAINAVKIYLMDNYGLSGGISKGEAFSDGFKLNSQESGFNNDRSRFRCFATVRASKLYGEYVFDIPLQHGIKAIKSGFFTIKPGSEYDTHLVSGKLSAERSVSKELEMFKMAEEYGFTPKEVMNIPRTPQIKEEEEKSPDVIEVPTVQGAERRRRK